MKEFGVKRRDMSTALQCFRSAPHEYPELKPLALYHRHQRSREVCLRFVLYKSWDMLMPAASSPLDFEDDERLMMSPPRH